MSSQAVIAIAVVLSCAAPAWPCSVVGPLPSAQELVGRAEVIVRARAEGLAESPGRGGTMAASATQVRFAVLDVLKGRLPTDTLEFNGTLSERDDRNDRPVPYDFIRPGGRGGNCYALDYRPGAEYLLLLRRGEHPAYAQPDDLTPYWSPLSPTNEQLFGGTNDAWLAWVALRTRGHVGDVPAQQSVPTPSSEERERRDQPVTKEDLLILEKAAGLLGTEAAWNRKDDRECADDEASGKRSLFCALQKACIDVLGKYDHRRAALQEVRFAVEDATRGQQFEHRLRDFNNLPSTTLADLRRILQMSAERVQARLRQK